jgi:hypothetical protein
MGIREDFIPYIDGNRLLAPSAVEHWTIRGSDNGPMFLSEYLIMLNRNETLTSNDISHYTKLIEGCVNQDKLLQRAPGATDGDSIDDHLGVLAGYAEINTKVPFRLPFALYRFPQLIYGMVINYGVPSFLTFPLNLISAAIATFSGWNHSITDDMDARRLNWLLIQATKRKSVLMRLAGWIWSKRQAKLFGRPDFMNQVANLYYQPIGNNPYGKWWKQ